VEHTEVDDRDAAGTFADINESSVGAAGAETTALFSPCNDIGAKTAADAGERTDDEAGSVASSRSATSAKSGDELTSSSGESTSTGDSCRTTVRSTIKSEPSDEEQSSRGVNSRRCHDNATKACRCAQQGRDDGRLSIQFTAGCLPLGFTHRPDCPRGPPPTVTASPGDAGVTPGPSSRRRRRRSGLSRLRRTELRRRSRLAADSCDEATPMKERRLDVGRTAPSDVTSGDVTGSGAASADDVSGEPRTMLCGHNRVASSDASMKFDNAVHDVKIQSGSRPTRTVDHSITTETQPSAPVSSSVASLSTKMTARRSPETARLADNEAYENATVDGTGERKQVKTQRSLVSAACGAAPAAGILPAVPPSSLDVARTTVHDAPSNEVASLRVWRTLDDAVRTTPLAVPSLRLSPPTPTVFADFAPTEVAPIAAARSLMVAAPHCVMAQRRVYGEKQRRGVVTWSQVRGMAPVLRCALTALKYHVRTVALFTSPAYYIPRHMPVLYPRYRLVCYPPAPCV